MRAGSLDLGGAMRDYVGAIRRDNPDLAAAARVKSAWNAVAAPRAAAHVTGVYVVPKTDASEVVVFTDTPLWASELAMQSELLRLKLNMELQRRGQATREEQVRTLRFVPSRERYLSKERRQSTHELLREQDDGLARVEPVALPPEEEAALRAAVAGIEDEQLREAAFGAAKASLEWQRGLEEAGRVKSREST